MTTRIITRTTTRILAATLALLLAATVAATGARAETVRIARQFGISYLPLIVMQEAGLLEAEGKARGLDLRPEFATFTGGAPINDALISGNIDLAAGGVGPMLTIWAKTRSNLKVKGVAALNSMPIWLNTSNPAVRSIKDFTDQDRIALPAVKVSIQAVVLQMAAQQAFGPGQEHRLDPLTISMGHPDGITALLSDNSQITGHFTSAPYMYEEEASPRVHRVLDSFDVLGGPHTFNVVWAATRYHDAHPKVIEAFVAALDRAMALIRQKPEDAAATWIRVENARLSPEDTAAMIRRPENQWTTTPRRIMQFLAFMRETGAVNQQAESWKELFFPEIHHLEGS